MGILLLRSKASHRIQAALGALVGGMLVASTIGYFVSLLVFFNKAKVEQALPQLELPAKPYAWFDFVKMLLSPFPDARQCRAFCKVPIRERSPSVHRPCSWSLAVVLALHFGLQTPGGDGE